MPMRGSHTGYWNCCKGGTHNIVPLEGIDDRMSGLPPWDNSPPVRYLGLPEDAHVGAFLLAE
jgi:hypothetical protein